jgi:flavin reductase (DIM6/NTAB) family NADH-FMN oxidoreductase RutF
MQENNKDLFLKHYRSSIGLFATGVTVLIAERDGDIRGMTANAVTSLSLEPVQLIVCPAKEARFSQLMEPGTQFTVNILGVHQEQISNYFAGPESDKEMPENIDLITWRNMEIGIPYKAPCLSDSVASFACNVKQMHDGGDHWIVVAEVLDIYQNKLSIQPLLFFGGSYHHPSAMHRQHLKAPGY